MKSIIAYLFAALVALPLSFSQNDDIWEKLGERLATQAERLADQAERIAERNAASWEASADRLSRKIERKWGDKDYKFKIKGLPGDVAAVFCPDGVFLGIESNSLSEEKARKLGFDNLYGSYVSKVMDNTAAKEAGLQPFDYIYGVEEQRTSDNQNLADILEDFKPGDEVTLHLIRKGQKQTIRVKLKSYDDFDWEEVSDESERAFLGVSPAGDEDEDDMDGVTVEVVDNSTAEAMGLKDGDVVTAINGYPVLDFEDLSTAVGNSHPGEQVEVIFRRDGREMNVKQPIKSYDEVYQEDDEGYEEGESSEDEQWSGVWEYGENNVDEEFQEQEGEERAFLGIYAEQISKEKAKKLGYDNPYGSFITGILKNTAADKAGLQPFDYVFGVDEFRVGENQSLNGILQRFKPGDKATVHFIRKSKKSSAGVTFGRHADAEKTSRNRCQDPFFGIVQDFSKEPDKVEGIMVRPVKNTTASELGLQDGDVIQTINGFKMIDWTDITTAIEMLNPGETITVEYLRNGKTMKSSKPIKSYAETKNCKDCDCGEKEEFSFNSDSPGAFEFNFKGLGTNQSEPSKRIDVSGAKVSMEEVNSSEAGTLKSKGIDLSSNSLSVEGLNLSPNPGNGMFNLEFRLPGSGNTTVRVFNASGRTIYEYELGQFSGNFSDEIDISQNGAGNYYLQVVQDSKVFTKKIVLQGK